MPAADPVPKTVLIVEDDPDSREMFVELLRGGGYSVIAARNGRDAMTFLSLNPSPDVILLDLFMPEMDGWQFRRAQDADPRLAGIPVVIVTAVGAARNSAVQAGAAAFLQKPVAADDLLETLAKILPRAPETASADGGETVPEAIPAPDAGESPKRPS